MPSTVLSKSGWLTSGVTVSMMSPSSETRGMKFTMVPKGLNSMSVAKPVAMRIGISPPTWKTAFWPLMARSRGCARMVARPSAWSAWMKPVMSSCGSWKAKVGDSVVVVSGRSGWFCCGGTVVAVPGTVGPKPPPMK